MERLSAYFSRAPDLDCRFRPIIYSTNNLHLGLDKNLTNGLCNNSGKSGMGACANGSLKHYPWEMFSILTLTFRSVEISVHFDKLNWAWYKPISVCVEGRGWGYRENSYRFCANSTGMGTSKGRGSSLLIPSHWFRVRVLVYFCVYVSAIEPADSWRWVATSSS